MGTAYSIVNHTKKEYLFGHQLDGGYKFYETIYNLNVGRLLLWLLSNDWKGDKIAMENEYDFEDIESSYKNVSHKYACEMNENIHSDLPKIKSEPEDSETD